MEYVGADNERHRPIMIHRALFGSIERFFAILVEHYAGAFPAVARAGAGHGAPGRRSPRRLRRRSSSTTCARDGFRVEMRRRARSTRSARACGDAKLEKVPYVLVVGDDDVEHGTVGVNARGSDDPERGVPVDDFVARLAAEVVEPACDA